MHARSLIAIAVAAVATLTSGLGQAQVRKITSVPQPVRQAPATGVATFGTPSPAGLASPNPAQLTPPGPASLTPPGSPNLSSPGVAPGSAAIDAGIALPTYGGGGGTLPYAQGSIGSSTSVMGGAPASYAAPPSAVDIARAFIEGDLNRDGELSRSEALRIGILNVPFDELDRNHDGSLTRFEYEDGFR